MNQYALHRSFSQCARFSHSIMRSLGRASGDGRLIYCWDHALMRTFVAAPIGDGAYCNFVPPAWMLWLMIAALLPATAGAWSFRIVQFCCLWIYMSTSLQVYKSTTYQVHLTNIHIVESTTVYRHLVEQFGTRRSYEHRLVVESSRKVGSIFLLSYLLVHIYTWYLRAYDHSQDLQYIVFYTIYNQRSIEPI